ncbi:MAG TPA: 50S ribosomal protein L4 [Gemmataceae bacterium]|nr:50S ribosomal protein L4 [Gemmataceae bacterium]
MLTLNVYNRQGESVGTVEIDPNEFGGKINRQLLHDVVLMHLANQRAGTHSTLRRGEVEGSTRKLFRQKGTGNARVGTRRTNKRRGGGTAKGPKPRDYEYHLPKKAVRAATRMALLSKFQDNETVVIDDLTLPEIKTKTLAGILKALKLDGTTCLIGTAGYDLTLYKSGRNIPGVEILPTSQFNAYAVLRPKRLLLTRAALDELRRKGAPPAEGQTTESKAAEGQAGEQP